MMILVLTCAAYMGAWSTTQRAAVQFARRPWIQSVVAPCPFVLREDMMFSKDGLAMLEGAELRGPRRYYLWFFGAKMMLPIKCTWRELQEIDT
ncbi:MAG: hypothetical protein KDB14_27475 [Planctomycetales bacterium]|nr:hypothetical protein [Planctomycetales bacterium]